MSGFPPSRNASAGRHASATAVSAPPSAVQPDRDLPGSRPAIAAAARRARSTIAAPTINSHAILQQRADREHDADVGDDDRQVDAGEMHERADMVDDRASKIER